MWGNRLRVVLGVPSNTAFWQLSPEQMSAAVVPGAELSISSLGVRPNVGDAPVSIRYWSSVYAGPFIVSPEIHTMLQAELRPLR